MAALTTGLIVAGAGIAQGVALNSAANAATAEGRRLAKDAFDRGDEAVTRYRGDLAQLLGRQRTSIAGQGIDTTQGTAAALRDQTKRIGLEDVATIRENFRREALGIRANAAAQARGLRNQAFGAFAGAGSTLLTSGIDAWEHYQAGRGPRAPNLLAPRSTSSSTAGGFRPRPVTQLPSGFGGY